MRLDSFLLKPIPPFRLDLTVWALRRRPDNVVDRWDGQTYCRVLPLLVGFAEIAVTQIGPPETLRLRVTVGAAALCPEMQQGITTILERLLGFRTDVAAFHPLASRDAVLDLLARRFTAFWSAGARMADWFTFTCYWTDWRKQDFWGQEHRSHRQAEAATPI